MKVVCFGVVSFVGRDGEDSTGLVVGRRVLQSLEGHREQLGLHIGKIGHLSLHSPCAVGLVS